jgi:thiol:disulfide interchange protein DsbD
MVKKLLVVVFFITSLFASSDFLKPSDAFKTSVNEESDRVTFQVKMDKSIYLYDEFIKVFIKSPKEVDITKELQIKKPVNYDDFMVHFDTLIVEVPKSLISKKVPGSDYELEFNFQGCSKKGLCYSPMSETFTGSAVSEEKEDSASNAGFLNPDDAFKTSVTQDEKNINFAVTLDKSIYLYDEFLNVSIVSPKQIDLTKELMIKEPVDYHDFKVHFDSVKISVPKSLIEEKIGLSDYKLRFNFQGCSKAGLCYSPISKEFDSKGLQAVPGGTKQSLFKKTDSSTDIAPQNETDAIADTLKGGNTLLILATFFGFGLLLALTPCIFPMVPILSSIIVRQSTKDGGEMSSKKGFILSLVYVLAMSAAYTIAGVLAGLFGANIQAMLQNPYVIVSFAAIFVALAFSMFGYYEIGLPQSWMTKINKASDTSSRHGGFTGVAVMGFLSALIVGPCVAPPLAGALIYIGQTGDAFLGGAALFIMSLGMGVPLLAIGIGAGKYMPKPGGWMTTVSKVFGVIMLGIAIWMLDRIVPFAVTILLTVALLMGSAFYLIKNGNRFGKIVAACLMIASTAFVMYGVNSSKDEDKIHYTYVKSIAELEKVVSHARKPVMVDFWATWCVSCKELDNITFKDKEVRKELDKYLLVKVDVTKNTADDKELMKKFNIFGPPALVFLENGVELKEKRIIGYKPPSEFLKIVK